MRTTVAIDDNVLAAARRLARQEGVTLGQLIEAALRAALSAKRRPAAGPPVPVFHGDGLRPGVDASPSRTLLEALDDDTPVEKLR